MSEKVVKIRRFTLKRVGFSQGLHPQVAEAVAPIQLMSGGCKNIRQSTGSIRNVMGK